MLLNVGISSPHHPPKDKVTQNCSYYKEIAKIFSVLLSNYLDGWFFCFLFLVVFFFFLPPLPFLKSAEPTFFLMRLCSITLSGCLKFCLDYWPWGKERGSLNFICVATFFKTMSSNFADVMLVFSAHNCCLT